RVAFGFAEVPTGHTLPSVTHSVLLSPSSLPVAVLCKASQLRVAFGFAEVPTGHTLPSVAHSSLVESGVTMTNKDGMNYAPKGKPDPVVKAGEFVFSVAYLKHGHIYGMTGGLLDAGATLKYVYDDDPALVKRFLEQYPQATPADSYDVILNDPDTRLVASAAVTCDRAGVGFQAMRAGKDYFTDKAPFTTLKQIETARELIRETGKKYMVYYGEYVHVEAAVFAKQLIDEGAIGKVVQVLGLGPHRLNAPARPAWFFEKEKYGGILCDIGSHQIYQFLIFADVQAAAVTHSQIGNFGNPQYPELDDFGDATLVSSGGETMYFRVDWFTPDGLDTWGDGRMIILGTKGYIELRKYTDLAIAQREGNVYLANQAGVQYLNVQGKVGYPFFGQLILDCLNRTETAMTQHQALLAAELSIRAQAQAQVIHAAK
ncbi:MAG TPA: Gfo/Idh/MocA family oxidoreductase, partial [Candidatus Limiplasma sp.]|nr:Gfo/Idh/MocA family oxidoreductase [Candidatus Limiplasma sp.]